MWRVRRAGGRAPSADRAGGELTIGLVDPDPYLALAVRREFPAADVRTAGRMDDLSVVQGSDVVLIELNSPRVSQVTTSMADGVPVIGVGRPGHGEARAEQFDAVLVRPYHLHDLRRVVAEALEVDVADPQAPRAPRLATALHASLGPARLASVAVVAVLETAQPVAGTAPRTAVLAAAFLYATARLRLLRGTRVGALLDVAVAVALLALTGGSDSNYVVFALVAAMGAGVYLTAREAFLAGGLMGLSVLPSLVLSMIEGQGAVRVAPVVLAVLAYPAAALASAQVARMLGEHPSDSSVAVLREANRALESLYEIARELPRSLTLESVAKAILEEVHERTDATASLLLIEEAGVVYEVASRGLGEHAPLLAEIEDLERSLLAGSRMREVDDGDVPAAIRRAGPPGLRWTVAPCGTGGRRSWVVAGTPDPMTGAGRRTLSRLLSEAGLAVDNARLFSRVRDLAADDERMRIASDLHDGVAQALAHVRLELELLSRFGSEDADGLREETARLAVVTQRALADVRSTITDLRAVSLVGGLAVAIHDHCRDLRVLAGPTIDVRVRSTTRLDPEVEVELFQIFRTAVTVASRHADTERVDVLLDETDDAVRLVVEDDGEKMPPGEDRRAARESAGLRSMRERATRVGARLEVSRRDDGGTRLEVVYPLQPATEPAEVGA